MSMLEEMMLEFCRKAPEMFTQDKDFHHIGRVLLQLKNRWAASSSLFLHNGQNRSLISTFLLRRFNFVDNLSLINLQAKKDVLVWIFKFHKSSKTPSWFSSIDSPISRLYALHTEYWPLGSAFHVQLSRRSGWIKLPSIFPKNLAAMSISLSNIDFHV